MNLFKLKYSVAMVRDRKTEYPCNYCGAPLTTEDRQVIVGGLDNPTFYCMSCEPIIRALAEEWNKPTEGVKK